MKWLVGVDLRFESDGPIQFAAWLTKQANQQQEMIGVHVLEHQSVQLALGLYGPDGIQMAQGLPSLQELQERAEQDLARAIDGVDASRYFSKLELVVDEDVEKSLVAIADANHCDGMIIGRRAKQGKDRLIRLGRVARKLVRHLPKPIIVTPPDLKTWQVGDGPILIACDAHDDSYAACQFGIDLAKKLGRQALLAYVIELPEDWVHEYLSMEVVDKARQDLQKQGEKDLQAWLTKRGLDQHPYEIVQGDVILRLAAMAEDKESPLIVCGSRKLGVVTRFFVASVGTELAARLACPVAVIPPDLYA